MWRWLIVFIVLLNTSLHLMSAYDLVTQSGKPDMLFYIVLSIDNKGELVRYDPTNGERITVHTFSKYAGFDVSASGRIAYADGRDRSRVYVLNTASSNQPIQITPNDSGAYYPRTWSPDERYLAYVSYHNERTALFLWDGLRTINITANMISEDMWRISGIHILWSPDSMRAALRVWFDYPHGLTSKVYLWDGERTLPLSHNPYSEDQNLTWSSDGRLAFLSVQNSKLNVVVWDGSFSKDGLPYSRTVISPELTDYYYSNLSWTSTGILEFAVSTERDGNIQAYLWDGKAVTNVSYNPILHVNSPDWLSEQVSADGSSWSWSSDEHLMFCQHNSGWRLQAWDGYRITTVVQGNIIWAQWQRSGKVSVCSSG